MADIKTGDHVTWNSHGGQAEGTVKKKLTKDAKVSGHQVRASSDDPQFVVETDKGKQAAHKPSALHKG
ncbi:DUF2945 domain-containing protein [Sphingomonas morindae]|uniref:DUF2945 domain-containing protein n=1 Tax=Sphingomonas morindae TaxID=1541170 RepID=A0ABY4X3C6_9SPHN|nr:DUF2945 domain-containing protein [Sphingomonas morindae]USI71381.1 DUF2945 domain-containing protein [Sphingomonas morindae]